MNHSDEHAPLVIERQTDSDSRSTRKKSAKNKRSTLVISSEDSSLLERTEAWLELLKDRLTDADDRQMQHLIETALPTIEPPPAPVMLRQARRNAQARIALLEEFGALDAERVHELAHSKARNRFALATRWRQEGRILGINYRNKTYFPGFQFDTNGQPLPVIAKVIALFGNQLDGWQTALWFTLANGWLDGKRPIDLLLTDPDAVISAAHQESADAF